MDSPDAWLEFPSNERIFLTQICSLGRAPENRVIIAMDGVSRRHAVIRKDQAGQWMLMDMGSSNGTYLNGERLSRPAALRDGCVIEIGKQRMSFRAPRPLESAAASAPAATAECWLLAFGATLLGCRTPSDAHEDKTFENWSERCQRIIGKYRGQVIRALDDGFLAYWKVEGGDTRATTVATVLASLRAVQKTTEQFRFVVHAGTVTMRASATGGLTPAGPEVIYAIQLDKLARTLNQPVLITAAARERLGPALPTRALSAQELREHRGTAALYLPAEVEG